MKKTTSYNKMDPFRGNWALSGDVSWRKVGGGRKVGVEKS